MSESRTVILLYHRITATDADPQHLSVHPDRFAEQLEAVREVAAVVPLADVLSRSAAGRVAVTFDDGYRDNLTQALPVLRAAAAPATVFVTSSVLAGRELWWDVLEDLLLHGELTTTHLEVTVAGRPLLVDVRTPEGRARAVRALTRRLRALPPDAIDAVLTEVRDQAGATGRCTRHQMLTADELRLLAGDPLVEVGAHSRRHANLGVLDTEGRRAEIEGSRDDLAAVLGRPPQAFAYPFGMRGSFEASERAVRRAGFRLACANVPGRVTPRQRYRLPRHVVGDWSGDELAHRLTAWLAGRPT